MIPVDRSVRCLFVASLLQLILPRVSRAEGAVSFKYQTWQEDDGRIRVNSEYGSVEQSLPADAKLKLTGVIDSISGATPTGELPTNAGDPVPLSHMEDRRKAWQGELSKPFGRVNISAGYANSRESDYVSNGWSLNTLTDFNQKNTTLLLGLAGTSDDVKVFFQQPWEHKRSFDAIAGVTQLIDPNTTVSFNLGYGRATGYLSDPYRLIQKHVDLGGGLVFLRTFAENRPDARDKWTAFASVNHALPALNAAIEGTYRYYHDTFGVSSHTLGIEWYQKLVGDRLVLRPELRWYEQSAADFYRVTLDGTSITPTIKPNPAGPYYSADYRLSKMQTITYGVKLVGFIVPDRFSVDVSYERYTMHGRDSVTPKSAYVDANIYTVGARFSW